MGRRDNGRIGETIQRTNENSKQQLSGERDDAYNFFQEMYNEKAKEKGYCRK